MIKFYITKNCPECTEIGELLLEMNIAHEVIKVDIDTLLDPGISDNYNLPFLIDGADTIQGTKNIKDHLEELGLFKAQWDKFQSDSCYCDEEGEIE